MISIIIAEALHRFGFGFLDRCLSLFPLFSRSKRITCLFCGVRNDVATSEIFEASSLVPIVALGDITSDLLLLSIEVYLKLERFSNLLC